MVLNVQQNYAFRPIATVSWARNTTGGRGAARGKVGQSASGFEGAAWSKWGSFAVYGVKLHQLCATNRVPLSYEVTAANIASGAANA